MPNFQSDIVFFIKKIGGFFYGSVRQYAEFTVSTL